MVPDNWLQYKTLRGITVVQWIHDLSSRLQQLNTILSTQTFETCKAWIGGFFMPEAYITATRQTVAQQKKWSLEELRPMMTVCDDTNSINKNNKEDGFVVDGMHVQGAEWTNGQLHLSSASIRHLPPCRLSWIRKQEMASAESGDGKSVDLPIYLNQDRLDLLLVMRVPIPATTKAEVYYQRGVALIANLFR
jgi:dynein heavy chain 1